MRNLLATVMPRPGLFRHLMSAAWLAKPFAPLLERLGMKRVAAALALTPTHLPREMTGRPGFYPAEGKEKGRAVLLRGCVQSVIDPGINAATIRLLNRFGWSVTVAGGESCCGSLPHHMGKDEAALAYARRTIDQWTAENPDVIVSTSSGCGVTIKDYGQHVPPRSGLCGEGSNGGGESPRHQRTPCHAGPAARACSPPRCLSFRLLAAAWPAVEDRAAGAPPPRRLRGDGHSREPHLLRLGGHLQHVATGHLAAVARPQVRQHRQHQPAGDRQRKPRLHHATGPDERRSVVHTIELLDWAYGGPVPAKLDQADTHAH